MIFPKYNIHGFVPTGTHAVRLDEIEREVVAGDNNRTEIWTRFKAFGRQVIDSKLFCNFYFFGSFFSRKPNPSDIDVALDLRESAPPDQNKLWIFDQVAVKREYRTDVVFVEPSTIYKNLLPPLLRFSPPNLILCRVLSGDEQKALAPKLNRLPQELTGVEFKGILFVPLDERARASCYREANGPSSPTSCGPLDSSQTPAF
jgi:hypothetical protein